MKFLYFLLLPLLLRANAQDTGTEPQRLGLGTTAAILSGLSLPTLANSHLDHLRFLEKRDLNPENQKNYYSLWGSAMVDFIYKFPNALGLEQHFDVQALLVGFDRRTPTQDILGITAGYLHTSYNQTYKGDEGQLNSGFIAPYGNLTLEPVYIEGTLWGIYQGAINNRNIILPLLVTTGVANINTWQLEPHLEVGYIFHKPWGRYTPYCAFDYLMSWQGSYQEAFVGPYNATQESFFFSTLRSEMGVKLHNLWDFKWGYVMAKEKLAFAIVSYFIPSTQIDQPAIGQSFAIPRDYSNNPEVSLGIDVAVSIGKPSPLGLRLGYTGNFTPDGMSNKVQLIISKVF